MEPSWTTQLLRDICKDQGFLLECHPSHPSMCRIVFPDGVSTLFHSSTLNINGAASRIGAVDKAFTKFFLKKSGVSVPFGRIVFAEDWCASYCLTDTKEAVMRFYKDENLFPVIVKPNRGFQGRGVYKVYNEKDLERAIDLVLDVSNAALIEECVVGEEYRLVWYRGQLQAAYQKTPLRVVGDGVLTIGALLEDKRTEQVLRGRGDVILSHMDFIEKRLHGLGYRLDTVLPVDVILHLRDNANLSTGGDVVDVSAEVHADYHRLAAMTARALDLNLIGIDVICTRPIQEAIAPYWILEVAYTPGLHHYASLGQEQYDKVKKMYTAIIEQLHHERT